MNISDIVVAIDAEIAQLHKVKALLMDIDVPAKRKPGRPAGVAEFKKAATANSAKSTRRTKRRTISEEGRAKIAAAQKARWEKSRRGAKKITQKGVSEPAKKVVATKTTNRKTAQVKKAKVVKKSTAQKAEAAATPSS